MENESALNQLGDMLTEIDHIHDHAMRQERLAKGLLAGNVCDWGAKQVVRLLEHGQLSFKDAYEKLQDRPWLIDDLDRWTETLNNRNYRCAAVFVDNSGLDIVLGVIPFVRELLRRGTKVIIVANTAPALNDITRRELEAMCPRLAQIDAKVLGMALDENRLIVMDHGQGSPCLDLRRINVALSDRVKTEQVDLVLIEGMGRALHTNFDAQFSCDALKVAVVKNEWLANRLGGRLFSVIFRFQQLSTTS